MPISSTIICLQIYAWFLMRGNTKTVSDSDETDSFSSTTHIPTLTQAHKHTLTDAEMPERDLKNRD